MCIRDRGMRGGGGWLAVSLALTVLCSFLPSCGGTTGLPVAPGPSRSADFPSGDAFIFGVILDEATGAGLENLAVTITPGDGLALELELESPTQAAVHTNRRGEFAFSGLARGTYVLFIRFDASHRGYGELVRLVESSPAPSEMRLFPVPIGLRFARPTNGGTVAASDTAVLRFTRLRLQELKTLSPESAPLYARVQVYGGGEPREPSTPGQPGEVEPGLERGHSFEAVLTGPDAGQGEARVPLSAGGLAGELRLESYLGLHLVYRDPRGERPGAREIKGQAISVVRR